MNIERLIGAAMNLENSNTEQNPFGIPEGYFEGFEATIEARLAEEQLREIVKSPGFATPEGYFASVEPQVMRQLEAPKTKVVSLFSRRTLYTAVSVAAAIVMIVTIFNNKPVDIEPDFAGIDTETLQTYINSDAIAFTDSDLIDLVSEDDLTADFLNEEEITDEMIESYLLENLDDIDLITTYEE